MEYFVSYFKALKFARSSEKQTSQDQQRLFNEAETIIHPANQQLTSDTVESIEIKSHKRKRGGRKPFPKEIPREEVIHDLTDAEKICSCGETREKIDELITEKLDIVPAKITIIKHICLKYSCKKCLAAKQIKNAFKTAENPAEILPKSNASAGLFAHILTNKFCDHLPYYRQENIFARHGIDISRANMSAWQIQFYEQYDRLQKLFYEDIFKSPVLLADETTLQVLQEKDRKDTQKSYMYALAGKFNDREMRVFSYRSTRSANFLSEYLENFGGILHTDGFTSYDALCRDAKIPHAGCWAHTRRKFRDYNKHSPGGDDFSKHILKLIQQLYRYESTSCEQKISLSDLRENRQKVSRAIVENIFTLLEQKQRSVVPESNLGKAIGYALNQREKLKMFLEFPQLTLDTDAVENAIRPFVLGRKNWLFSGSPRGADSSALVYSLIETAKANKIEPYFYLRHLFKKLPLCNSEDEMRELLPHRIDPAAFKT